MSVVRRRQFLAAAGGLALLPLTAHPQGTTRTARVGWLGWTGGGAPSPVPLESFRAALRERGWTEGRNLAIETRSGDRGRARDLAVELQQTGVDVIVAQGPMVFGARPVAGSTPLVFTINGDPVEAKLVASLARPGGNLTGITALSAQLSGKRLELLKELAPETTRFAAIANQAHPGVQIEFEATQAAAQRLGASLRWLPVYAPRDFPAAFDAIARESAQALVAIPDSLMNDQAKAVAEFALARRIPAISGWAEFVEAGNLLSYGPSARGFYRHVAVYVDKLLRGAKPADLPVEQPSVLELVVNLATARALGLKIPQALLVRADRVVGAT